MHAYTSPAAALRSTAGTSELGTQPTRLAVGADRAIWMVVSNTSVYTGNLAGLYRGYLIDLDQPAAPPTLEHTCGDVGGFCADGGCDTGLTQCLTCAPSTIPGVDGKVDSP